MTTTYRPLVTRDDGDFLAEVEWFDGGGDHLGKQLVGWYDTYQQAYDAAAAASTNAATRDAHEATDDDTPACRTCGEPVEIDTSVGLFDDECDACGALCCDRCGAAVSFDDATFLGDGMACAACYAAQQAHVAALAALAAADDERRAAHEDSLVAEYEAQIDEIVASDHRRAYRESLAEAGSAADEAQRLAQFLRQAEDAAHEVDATDPPRTEAAEDRYNRGGW
jgi:hypothetical protein